MRDIIVTTTIVSDLFELVMQNNAPEEAAEVLKEIISQGNMITALQSNLC